ncbi:hypothetical protein [Niallia sp. Krafla_26]|uniref:hypothetical protein n=1 Tax=Niallia sp. Krafla_26 TaxID=3064703 RepID=UPI003D182C6F
MGLFGKLKESELVEEMTGLVRGRVEIKRLDRNTRSVKAYLVSCDTSKTIYKVEYETKAKTDFFAYNHAYEELKRVIKREDYILFDDVSTNAELPGIVTTSKRMR